MRDKIETRLDNVGEKHRPDPGYDDRYIGGRRGNVVMALFREAVNDHDEAFAEGRRRGFVRGAICGALFVIGMAGLIFAGMKGAAVVWQ